VDHDPDGGKRRITAPPFDLSLPNAEVQLRANLS